MTVFIAEVAFTEDRPFIKLGVFISFVKASRDYSTDWVRISATQWGYKARDGKVYLITEMPLL